MPLPSDPAIRRGHLLRWSLGYEPGADFLEEIAMIARLADNLADREGDRHRQLADLLFRCLVTLPRNEFFRANCWALSPSIHEAITGWLLADEWRLSGDVKRQTFGFVMRESTDRIATATALLLGGPRHAETVAREIYDLCHAPFPETVEQWVSED